MKMRSFTFRAIQTISWVEDDYVLDSGDPIEALRKLTEENARETLYDYAHGGHLQWECIKDTGVIDDKEEKA